MKNHYFRWEEESGKENKLKDKEELPDRSQLSRDNINILLESNRENLYSNLDSVGIGLGLRASLPKMPSFRRKKIPSPVPEDGDDTTKMSDSEEIVHDSDSDFVNISTQRERKSSTSSVSSSVSSESSDSDSDSSDESSSDSASETEETQQRSATPEIKKPVVMEVTVPEEVDRGDTPVRDEPVVSFTLHCYIAASCC